MKKLLDHEKATLFLYLEENGLPTWATGNNQHLALALLAGWGEKRAKEALERSVKCGYADKE